MIKYAKVINEETGLCEVGIGTNAEFYKSIGMIQLDVQQSDIDGAWYLTEKCPMKTNEQKAKEEQERIALLNMTGADVERAIYKVKGIDFDDILAMVKNNPAIDEKALKIEFKANNFFRGNPYISQVGLLLGFTEGMLDKFFETKDYHYLSKYTLEIQPTPSEAVITINGEITNKVTLPYNTEIEYTVSLDNYVTQTDKLSLTENKVIEIELQPETPITQE